MALVDFITHRLSNFSSIHNPLKCGFKRKSAKFSDIDGDGFSQRSHPSALSNISLNQISHDVKVVYLPLSLNPTTHHIVNVYQLNDKRLLLVVENFVTGCTEIYLESIKNLNSALAEKSPVATVNKLCQLSALDAIQGTLALYSVVEGELYTFQFAADGDEVYVKKTRIPLKSHFKKQQLPKIRQLLFILGTTPYKCI
ncbi:hypothetical protein K493DRAFT_301572 [Basidiobolus meristosporus CBS 931.73]|uniref:CNH domain-containing protein n=1 Tax=Basidiobolus meristosporus CBS 931.73 TaxID=1314790 RepID=A0A1Y1YBF1_9FUNG|nr:hypothetical protein K493DRAFT_301572 [Basidiobolus meristosporus CBS 931.73]|eukprot:ORX95272.1 hypothetical protein K493DRAFT_301572 [Basidiobolus meristosporus CBS 931.73]